jgi:hypothetical protein
MKKGDSLVCIDAGDCELTNGKVYVAQSNINSELYIHVMDDHGDIRSFTITRFRDDRKKRIAELLKEL